MVGLPLSKQKTSLMVTIRRIVKIASHRLHHSLNLLKAAKTSEYS